MQKSTLVIQKRIIQPCGQRRIPFLDSGNTTCRRFHSRLSLRSRKIRVAYWVPKNLLGQFRISSAGPCRIEMGSIETAKKVITVAIEALLLSSLAINWKKNINIQILDILFWSEYLMSKKYWILVWIFEF